MAIEPSWGIGQIWVYPFARWQSTAWFQSLPTPQNISDHNPIGAEFDIFPSTGTPATITPLPPTFPAPPPVFVTDALSDVHVLRVGQFDDPCALSQWASRWKTEKLSNGILEIIGEELWQASASRYREFTPGQGVLLRFQFTPGSEFEFLFDNPGYDLEPTRRFSINIFNLITHTGHAGCQSSLAIIRMK